MKTCWEHDGGTEYLHKGGLPRCAIAGCCEHNMRLLKGRCQQHMPMPNSTASTLQSCHIWLECLLLPVPLHIPAQVLGTPSMLFVGCAQLIGILCTVYSMLLLVHCVYTERYPGQYPDSPKVYQGTLMLLKRLKMECLSCMKPGNCLTLLQSTECNQQRICNQPLGRDVRPMICSGFDRSRALTLLTR